jgi:hypothetical protein
MLMRKILPLLALICFSGALYGQQRYLYQFTLTNGTQQFVNMDRIRLVYDRAPSGARLVLGGPAQILEVNQTRGYIFDNSCGNLVSAVERYYEYTGFKTRGFLFNPVFVSQVDRLPDGRARITFFLPNQSIETQTPYNTIVQLLDKCVSGSALTFTGDSTITINQSSSSVSFSVNASALNIPIDTTDLVFIGDSTITVTQGVDSVFFSVNSSALNIPNNLIIIGDSTINVTQGPDTASISVNLASIPKSSVNDLPRYKNDEDANLFGLGIGDAYIIDSGSDILPAGTVKVILSGPPNVNGTVSSLNALPRYKNDDEAKSDGRVVGSSYLVDEGSDVHIPGTVKVIII